MPVRLSRAPSTPEHVVYASPSTRVGGTFEDAARNFNGPAVARMREAAKMLPSVRDAQPALGYWKDGAEESVVVHVNDPNALRGVAENLGRQFDQKAVLHFSESPDGPDARHVIVVPERDAGKIHADMMRHGIEYKTLIPLAAGTRIEAVDVGDSMRPEFLGYAREAGATSHQIRAGSAGMWERGE